MAPCNLSSASISEAVIGANASLKFVNLQRGFMLCDVTKDRWEASLRVLDKVSAADGKIYSRAKLTGERDRVAVG